MTQAELTVEHSRLSVRARVNYSPLESKAFEWLSIMRSKKMGSVLQHWDHSVGFNEWWSLHDLKQGGFDASLKNTSEGASSFVITIYNSLDLRGLIGKERKKKGFCSLCSSRWVLKIKKWICREGKSGLWWRKRVIMTHHTKTTRRERYI